MIPALELADEGARAAADAAARLEPVTDARRTPVARETRKRVTVLVAAVTFAPCGVHRIDPEAHRRLTGPRRR
jgi:hypothetical protein